MRQFDFRSRLRASLLLLAFSTATSGLAGGSGLNTVVVINQSSSNSCELANYFCERRQVPPENVLRIAWSGGNISWSSDQFQTNLLDPLLAMIAARGLAGQVDYVVLSMDIPFQTVNGSAVNSTTAALFYGLKNESGPDAAGITNSYAASEAVFSDARPASAPGYSFLTTMITASTLAQAESLVDQGVLSDGTFPTQTVVLAKSSDVLRNIRYRAFDNAILNTRIRGGFSMVRTNSDSPLGQTNLLGYQTGLANFSLSPQAFVPGSIADSLTSFGGIIFGPNSQTTLLAFIQAGAAGSYGTVTEPYPTPDKFPDPQVYFYQSRGFSLAECYYQSLVVPYQGLIVGEPLAAPFAKSGSGVWVGTSSNAVLAGTAGLSVQFNAANRERPIQQIDLFVDGKYFSTLTNLPPASGDQLRFTLAGFPVAYSVPANATLTSIAQDLAALINAPSNTASAELAASAHGDRVELHFVSTDAAGPVTPLNVRASGNGPAASAESLDSPAGLAPFFATGSATNAGPPASLPLISSNVCVASQAPGVRAYSIGGTVQVGTWLQLALTKTNGIQVLVSVTNQAAGATSDDVSLQLFNAINASPDLAGADGVHAEDFVVGVSGPVTFDLYARSTGYSAALAQVLISGSAGLRIRPLTLGPISDNLTDLQPRDHLDLTAGADRMPVTFPLDTTLLADGYHELTAVAYEGSHVRTQTRTSLPVLIQNTALSATLTLLDLPSTAPVQGIYHLEVDANTNSVSSISLFTTGGLWGTVSNQVSATFTVDGAVLGAGLHPFYAIVQTGAGIQYRTETQWVRLVH